MPMAMAKTLTCLRVQKGLVTFLLRTTAVQYGSKHACVALHRLANIRDENVLQQSSESHMYVKDQKFGDGGHADG